MLSTDRELMLMKTADLWAEKGTCPRLQVGAVFAREGRILVQGYNGAPAGLPHCNHDCDCPPTIFYNPVQPDVRLDPHYVVHYENCNSQKPCDRAVHAEQNGIAWAARVGVGLDGADLYSTHQPCINCARSIINAGIQTVSYRHPYRLKDGIQLLQEAGIYLYQFTDNTRTVVIGSIE